MDDTEVQLVAEQLKHLVDLQKSQVDTVAAELAHYHEMTDRRLQGLEKQGDDHEQRIRAAPDGVVQFKMFAGLASGGSTIISILALVKAFFGL